MEGVAFSGLRAPRTPIGEDVCWTVQPGDYWAIAGLHGSGKSDFLMMTAGLIAPLRGAYRFLGEPMPIFEEDRLAHRLRLGLVFDGGQPFTRLTVRENIALPLRYHQNLDGAETEARVDAMIGHLGLDEWSNTTAGSLGRNLQKKVGLARALILRPEMLLLDNPLGGLDFRHTHWWLQTLDQLSKGEGIPPGKPMTLVVTTAGFPPWKGKARQFAVLGNRLFQTLGDWSGVEAANPDTVGELLPGNPASVDASRLI
jgi:ABC-type transporter Mla maintaining outer membrane lipid asymmetry ATPase subunit MlaF